MCFRQASLTARTYIGGIEEKRVDSFNKYLWNILAAAAPELGALCLVMRNRQESQLLSASSSVGETVNKHTIKCVITDIGKCYDSLRENVGETDKVCEGSAVREFSLRKSAAGTVRRENPRQRWSKVEKVRYVPRAQGRPTVGGAGERDGQETRTRSQKALRVWVLYLIQQESFGGLQELAYSDMLKGLL